jgi:hypothetical protein
VILRYHRDSAGLFHGRLVARPETGAPCFAQASDERLLQMIVRVREAYGAAGGDRDVELQLERTPDAITT